MEKIVSFIPVKLNNQRLPGKNVMNLNGKPLCDYIFQTIRRVNSIAEKYVYCSDDKIRKYIPDGLTFLKRDPYLDGYQIRGLEIIDYFVRDVDADIYVLAHITQPFVRQESIEHALNKVIYDGYDSAFSCIELRDYCWYQRKPLNYDMQDIVVTQELEPVYQETGAFFIFRKEVFKNRRQRIGDNPYMEVVNSFEAVDIDTAEDFCFAEVTAKYLEEGRYNKFQESKNG